MPVPQLEPRTNSQPDAPTVFGAEPSQRSGRPSSRTTVVALSVAVFLLAGFFGTRALLTSGPGEPLPATASLAPRTAEPRVEPPAPRDTLTPTPLSALETVPNPSPARTAAERARTTRRTTPSVRPKAATTVAQSPPATATAEPVPTAAETAAAKARARLLGERQQARLLE
jgi:hypothetical protein